MLKTMMVYHADFNGDDTFKLLPLTDACPYNEILYDPSTSILAVISKEYKETPHMFPRIKSIIDLSKKSEERLMMDTYYEYYIENVEDMKYLIHNVAINPFHPSLNVLNNKD